MVSCNAIRLRHSKSVYGITSLIIYTSYSKFAKSLFVAACILRAWRSALKRSAKKAVISLMSFDASKVDQRSDASAYNEAETMDIRNFWLWINVGERIRHWCIALILFLGFSAVTWDPVFSMYEECLIRFSKGICLKRILEACSPH